VVGAQHRYQLSGCSPFGPGDFADLELEGTATMVLVYQGQEVMLYSSALTVGPDGTYAWRFAPKSTGPGLLEEVGGPDGSDIELRFTPGDGAFTLHSMLVVGFAPDVAPEPGALRVRAVYFDGLGSRPFIDDFAAVAHTR